jgi:FkbM family methyltransferase
MKNNDINSYERFLFFGGGVMAERLYNQIDCAEKKLIGVFDLFDDDGRNINSFKSFVIRNAEECVNELKNSGNAIVVAIGNAKVCNIVDKLLNRYPYISDRLFVVNPYSSLRFCVVDDELASEERIPYSDAKYTLVRNMLNDEESLKHFDLLVSSKPYDGIGDTYELVPYSRIKEMYFYAEDYWNTYKFNESISTESATVIDCGAYIGDSVVSIVKGIPEKKVYYYALEPLAENVRIMKGNSTFFNICKSFTIIEAGVGDKNENLYFHLPVNNDKEGGRFTHDPDGAVDTLEIRAIDDLQIDIKGTLYIKMDVEGSEMAALKGAEQTIKRYHPFLAICLYHRKNDLAEIPLLIERIGLSYDYYLRGGYHTILWAIPKR